MATLSSILVWRRPQTEAPGRQWPRTGSGRFRQVQDTTEAAEHAGYKHKTESTMNSLHSFFLKTSWAHLCRQRCHLQRGKAVHCLSSLLCWIRQQMNRGSSDQGEQGHQNHRRNSKLYSATCGKKNIPQTRAIYSRSARLVQHMSKKFSQ